MTARLATQYYVLNIVIEVHEDKSWSYFFKYVNRVFEESGFTSEYAALKALGVRFQAESLGRA